jgi:threonine dehydrogenase-like Zn-dependent dehydrogenase
VLKTTAEQPVTLDLAPLVVDEQRIIGSRCGRFAPALDWLASSPPPVESMIDEVLTLDAGHGVLSRASQPGTLKVLLDPTHR